MEKILDQSDIDARFAQASGGSVEPPAPVIVSYGFGRAGQISVDQMRAISMLIDQLARNLTHTLGAWLRSQINVMLAANEQLTFTDFLSCLPEPSYVILLRLEPLGGIALLEINLSLAMMMVDVLLGGRGAPEKERDLTDIEDTIFLSVVEIVVRELNVAWETAGLQFVVEKREARDRIARLMPSEERTLCISLDIQMDGVHGMLNLCVPAVVLNALHRRLLAVREQPRRRFENSAMRIAQLMSDATFPVTLRLPAVSLPARSIRSLQVGELLEFPLPKHTQAELLIGGVRVGSAVPVGRGDFRAALLQSTYGTAEKEFSEAKMLANAEGVAA